MFGQEHSEYDEYMESMKICYEDPKDLDSLSYDSDYETEILDGLKKSAWLQILPSTTKLEVKGVEYTSRGMITEQTKLFSLVFNAFVFM